MFTSGCEEHITVHRFELLNLTTPTVEDNSGPVPHLSVDVGNGSPITQDTNVTWTAMDYAGNRATCMVYIKLKGQFIQKTFLLLDSYSDE